MEVVVFDAGQRDGNVVSGSLSKPSSHALSDIIFEGGSAWLFRIDGPI